MKFIVCDASGSILRTGSCLDEDFRAQAGPGEFVYEGVANDKTQFIDLQTHTINNFRTMQAKYEKRADADGAEVHAITGLPRGASLVVNNNDFFQLEGDDTEVEFHFVDNGLYEIECSAVNYKPKSFDVDVER